MRPHAERENLCRVAAGKAMYCQHRPVVLGASVCVASTNTHSSRYGRRLYFGIKVGGLVDRGETRVCVIVVETPVLAEGTSPCLAWRYSASLARARRARCCAAGDARAEAAAAHLAAFAGRSPALCAACRRLAAVVQQAGDGGPGPGLGLGSGTAARPSSLRQGLDGAVPAGLDAAEASPGPNPASPARASVQAAAAQLAAVLAVALRPLDAGAPRTDADGAHCNGALPFPGVSAHTDPGRS